ncbi:MAG: RimK family alpha-L-glutamate ligase [Clostridia bacterium]|nr:RimK family alpha-L-glutamate ligase [Clostridia bacterium]
MARIAAFIERYTLRSSAELSSLAHYRQAAFELGHQLDFLFRNELKYLGNYEAIFIRALTDPLNTSYVVARLAQMKGLRVIDDPESIRICCDKVNMYQHLLKKGVPIPRTLFLDEREVCKEKARELLQMLGSPLVLKAPNSCFSQYVDKVVSPEGFVQVGKRFLRRANRLVVQQYIPSTYDWRVVILDGQVLSVVKYIFAPNTWRIMDRSEQGERLTVVGIPIEKVDPRLLQTALRAAECIGKSLYGIDIKETKDEYLVIEVNDNPNIDAGDEDQCNPAIYKQIIHYLAGEKGEEFNLSSSQSCGS